MAAVKIPSQYKALIYDKPGTISIKMETFETPTPGVGEVLINLTHSGVCHSDLAVMTNGWSAILPYPVQPGQVGGHEGVGKIVASGPGAESSGLKIGDRVGIKWMASVCGNCLPCLSGRDSCCVQGKMSGYYHPGTFQQYVLSSANYVTPIPDGLASNLAAPILCGGLTVYSALKKSQTQPGDTVLIPGAGGGLGHLAVQIASKGMGLRVLAIDSGDKGDFITSLGAEHFFDITKYNRDKEEQDKLVADIKAVTLGGFGVAAAVICAASNTAYKTALESLRFGGTLVCVGVPEGDPLPIASAYPSHIIAGERRIVGSSVGNRKDAIEVMDLAARGVVKTHIVTESMSNLTEIFKKMDNAQLQGRVVIDLSRE